MRIVLALGGNALLKPGEPLSAEKQLANIKNAAFHIAKLSLGNQLVITHGNGPQVGLLALQSHAKPYPLDVLDAETEGMIGYLLEQEIANYLANSRPVATLLTRVEVNPKDPAFQNATKPIGPLYSKSDVERLAQENPWQMMAEGQQFRRVVASPLPQRILSIDPILWLLAHDAIVIAAGGGGIPVIKDEISNEYKGTECVIDKDLCSALLATQIAADHLFIVTNVNAVYLDWQKVTQKPITEISATALEKLTFQAGTMAPKVKAACHYVNTTQKSATIGALEQMDALIQHSAGTRITY